MFRRRRSVVWLLAQYGSIFNDAQEMIENSSFEYSIDPQVQCVFIRHYGILDADIIIERGKAVASHKDYRRGLNRLLVTAGCNIDLNSDDFRKISALIASQGQARGTYREAIMLDDLLGHGLVRMFASLKQHPGVEYEIFRSNNVTEPQDLRLWLGLEADFQFPEFLHLSQP